MGKKSWRNDDEAANQKIESQDPEPNGKKMEYAFEGESESSDDDAEVTGRELFSVCRYGRRFLDMSWHEICASCNI